MQFLFIVSDAFEYYKKNYILKIEGEKLESEL